MTRSGNSTCLVDSSGSNTKASPLGLEFGEFMMDGDFWALLDRQGVFPNE